MRFLLLFMLLSATTYGQDIAAVTLSGKTLKVEYDDNSVRYMRKVIHAEAEAFIYGLDAIDNGFKIQYANVSATTKATEPLTLTGNYRMVILLSLVLRIM